MRLEKPTTVDQHLFQFLEENEAILAQLRSPSKVSPSADFIQDTRRRLLGLGHIKEASIWRAA